MQEEHYGLIDPVDPKEVWTSLKKMKGTLVLGPGGISTKMCEQGRAYMLQITPLTLHSYFAGKDLATEVDSVSDDSII